MKGLISLPRRFNVLILLSALILHIPGFVLCQEDLGGDESSLPKPAITQEEAEDIIDIISKSLKRALEEIDMQKAMEKADREERISESLDAFMQNWIGVQSSEREKSKNAIIRQDWNDLPETPPQHLQYYLRDYIYSVQGKNVIETNSVTYPFEADVEFLETLYVEQAPLLAEPRADYQYAATTLTRIILQYDKNSALWMTKDTYAVSANLNKGWPPQIKKKLRQYFIPAE
ncbi:MAG: hypothetical protein ABH843_00855 [Candidatus Omnitrophota bacterium]